ncbi:MAG: PaaI family thioesterase [Pseudomonadota bacterium]
MQTKMDKAGLEAFLRDAFPQAAGHFVVDHVAAMEATIRMPVRESHLRPGGTVSGPSMFALADVGVYLAVLAMIGPKALAVTTNASMDFMRKPEPGRDLLAATRLLKLGRVLAVGDVLIRSDGQSAPVARATLTYSIPPEC